MLPISRSTSQAHKLGGSAAGVPSNPVVYGSTSTATAFDRPTRPAAAYFFGGLIMICAPAVPGDINQGALSLALVDSPVDWGVAKGT